MPHSSLSHLNHRPWPMPETAWTWRQSWRDLLFAHWPVAAEVLRPLVPSALKIQEYEGTSWVGVVPFHMAGVAPRFSPDLPWLSAFPELNLRLYVEYEGKPGVWFLSLDATNPVAVWAARRFFHLPYFHTEISIQESGEDFMYQAVRKKDPQGLRFEANYWTIGNPYEAKPGTLEHWLTERYCLYAADPRGNLYRAEVHHASWPLQPADATIEINELTRPHGFELSGPPTHLHFAKRVDVIVWNPERLKT